MTGYDEARDWLDANAPEWRIAHAESTLAAGMTIGAPTRLRCEVTLEESVRSPYPGDGPWLKGEGDTILDAVQNAVGGLRSA